MFFYCGNQAYQKCLLYFVLETPFNPLRANPTKWLKTLVGLTLKELNHAMVCPDNCIIYEFHVFLEFSLTSFISFNRDLNRVCLVNMFSFRFSGSKFLINLRRQFRVRKIFSCT